MRHFVFLAPFAGCHAHGVVEAGGPDMSPAPAFAAHDKVDVLFLIDNSPGTSPKIAELLNRFPQLGKALDAAAAGHPASYHIGVVDSDLGAGPYTLNQGQCHPDGDRGALRVTAQDNSAGPPSAE